MKILVTGANGQVGSALQQLLHNTSHECIFTDRKNLDIRDEVGLLAFVLAQKPELVINCAAYTAVDKAENEVQACVEINQDAVRVLAEACHQVGASLIHISTDYVYHNTCNRPLLETDPTSPQSAYARTKLAGEKEALAACAKTVVLRTSWVYGLQGHNFLRTMQRLGKEKERLTIVSDQIGAPTFADDLATAILHFATLIAEDQKPYGIYNYAGLGVASWYDFAKAIFETYNLSCEVVPIPSSDYPTPAPRPHYSVLALGKVAKTGAPLRHWRDALADFYRLDTTM